jgi:nicotinate phosphoribosyltransferase
VWDGAAIGDRPTLEELRARRRHDLDRLDPGVRRLVNPHLYHVSLTHGLWRMQHDLVDAATSSADEEE